VDEVRELQRKAKRAGPHQELYRTYLITVSQMTDEGDRAQSAAPRTVPQPPSDNVVPLCSLRYAIGALSTHTVC
jgi:hypothetical protein